VNTTDRAVEQGRRRRRHSAEFKAQVVQACRQPGVSIASVALAHGLNANLLRRWLVERSAGAAATTAVTSTQPVNESLPGVEGKFLPVKLEDAHAAAKDIRIELRRGPTTMVVSWPIQEATACAAWLREWLR